MANESKKITAAQEAAGGAQDAAQREKARLAAQKLVRVRISCMNPAKRDLKGEIITVANSVVTMSKYVAYGEKTRDGWHVPDAILQTLRQAQYMGLAQGEDSRAMPEMQWMPEYAIEVLPPLTQAEIDQIALAQLQG